MKEMQYHQQMMQQQMMGGGAHQFPSPFPPGQPAAGAPPQFFRPPPQGAAPPVFRAPPSATPHAQHAAQAEGTGVGGM